MRAHWVTSVGLVLCLAACDGGGGSGGTGGGTAGMGGMGGMGGHETTASGGMGGATHVGGSTHAGGAGGTGGAGAAGGAGGGTGAPLAPTIDSVGPLAGALHVMWTNNTPDCDKIELDRKENDGTYATEYTLSGAATSQHDSEATGASTYCYKARCIKGAEASPDSNEKCGTP